MPKLPFPPDTAYLRKVYQPEHSYVLPAGSLLWRIHAQGGPYPTRWDQLRYVGPTGSRFDHHESDTHGHMLTDPTTGRPVVQFRGIIYLATLVEACVAEFFQNARVINRARRQPWLVGFETSAPLTLLDMKGLWPTVAGASMNINSGDRHVARAWSRAIYDAYPAVQGIWYGSSMHMNTSSIALYERGRHAIPPAYTVHIALADDRLLGDLRRIALNLNYRLI